LNEIEDVEKLAKETFKRGFDLLKYGSMPEGELTKQDKEKVVKKKELPTLKEVVEKKLFKSPGVTIQEPPKIIEAIPMNSSNGREALTQLGAKPAKKDEKIDLYDE